MNHLKFTHLDTYTCKVVCDANKAVTMTNAVAKAEQDLNKHRHRRYYLKQILQAVYKK